MKTVSASGWTTRLPAMLALASALKLNLDTVREVFSQTGAASRVLVTDGEDMQNRAHDCFFSGAHAAKDSTIAWVLGAEAEALHRAGPPGLHEDIARERQPPHPLQERPNHPARVVEVGQCVARLQDRLVEEVAQATWANACAVTPPGKCRAINAGLAMAR